MTDAAIVLLQLARTAVGRAALLIEEGEARSRAQLARDALTDAIEQRHADVEERQS